MTKIEYNGSVVATVEGGNTATLPIKNLKMKSDIKITVPEGSGATIPEFSEVEDFAVFVESEDEGELTIGYSASQDVKLPNGVHRLGVITYEDSPLPIEVSTEAEMTALLTSGEIGGVYKYTGTTGTYENGALYVLEAGVIKISLEVNSSDEGVFNFPVPSGVTTWSGMDGVVDETSQYVITTTIDTINPDVPKICRAGKIVDSFFGLVNNNINTDLVRVLDTLDYDNTYYSFVNTHGVGGGGSN